MDTDGKFCKVMKWILDQPRRPVYPALILGKSDEEKEEKEYLEYLDREERMDEFLQA